MQVPLGAVNLPRGTHIPKNKHLKN